MIAQGAEAKVYYREGDMSVVKERASIYSTTQKALDAIVLHNYLFPETAMYVIGFTRDNEGLLRIILTQPYIRCLRLATKEEIDALVLWPTELHGISPMAGLEPATHGVTSEVSLIYGTCL